MDINDFRERGKEMIDYVCNYLMTVQNRRVTSNVEPGYLAGLLPGRAPEEPEEWETIMEDVENKIMPGITHWQHPRFHAYFPSGNSFPSILGDILSDGLGVIGFSWAASPACSELEQIVLDWFAKAIGLPEQFISSKRNSTGGGVIQSSASECIFIAMLAARNQAIKHLKRDEENEDEDACLYLPKLVAYCSKESHSCVEKAAKISLIKLRILDTHPDGSFDEKELDSVMEKDEENGLFPFFVSTTLGSTARTSFDNIRDVGEVCRKRPHVWLHVDAAYAGNAFICPELRYLLDGIEFADSFNTNPNKWLLTNFDCSCFWVRDKEKLISAMMVDPLYLQHQNDEETVDYRHWGIPLSRRFRSLKLWFVFRKYGISGLQHYIRSHIRLAKYFKGLVEKDSRFEVVNDVRLGLVCFRLLDCDKTNQELLARINQSGELNMIPAMVNGKYIIRFCVNNENATAEDMDVAFEIIQKYASELLEPVVRKPKLTRTLSRRFSFTRSVSQEIYRRSISIPVLYDGGKPIVIPENGSDENLNNDLNDDVFEIQN